MKRLSLSLSLLFLLGAFSSCRKECSCRSADEDAVVFGKYYGFCGGENCTEIFKIANGLLYEDSSDSYPVDEPYNGNYTALPAAKYDLVKNFSVFIPAQLLNEPSGYIGQPDAYDQGGYVVELTENGTTRYWRIDTDTSSIPAYLHPLTDTLKTYIQKLQ